MTFDDLFLRDECSNVSQNFSINGRAAFVCITDKRLELSVLDCDDNTNRWEDVVDGAEDFATFMMLFRQAQPLPIGHRLNDSSAYTVPMGDRIRSIIDEICNNPQE